MTLPSFAPRSRNLHRSIAAPVACKSLINPCCTKAAATRRAYLALGLLGWVAFAISAAAQTAHSGGIVTLGSGFSNPYGVALDASGNVFVADYSNGAVKEILAVGGYTTINTLSSSFSIPTGVAVDAHGNVFVADNGNGAVKEILAVGGVIPSSSCGFQQHNLCRFGTLKLIVGVFVATFEVAPAVNGTSPKSCWSPPRRPAEQPYPFRSA